MFHPKSAINVHQVARRQASSRSSSKAKPSVKLPLLSRSMSSHLSSMCTRFTCPRSGDDHRKTIEKPSKTRQEPSKTVQNASFSASKTTCRLDPRGLWSSQVPLTRTCMPCSKWCTSSAAEPRSPLLTNRAPCSEGSWKQLRFRLFTWI